MRSNAHTMAVIMNRPNLIKVILHVAVWLCAAFLLVGAEENFAQRSYNLLNAYQAPLSALTSPGNYYFLEFPLEEDAMSPMCGDGTPFGFVFRRGGDRHVSKLLIELEGGPSCWGQDVAACCSTNDEALQTPWYSFYSQQQEQKQSPLPVLFPRLDTCTGVTQGFANLGAQELFARYSDRPEDLPIAFRSQQASSEGNKHQWWDVVGGRYSNVSDWSYILVPHCTLDWHLGHQEDAQSMQCAEENEGEPANSTFTNRTSDKSVYQRGGTNVQAVVEWVQSQFPEGLDALMVASGGRVGGCNSYTDLSSVASSIVASKLSNSSPASPNSLVVIEGSALWNPDLPTPDDLASRWNAMDIPEGSTLMEGLEDWIQSSPESLQVAWLASAGGTVGKDEQNFLRDFESSKGESIHVLQAPPSATGSWCPKYAFPADSTDEFFAVFLQSVVERMSWNNIALESIDMDQEAHFKSSFRLSFFSISLIILGLVTMSWIVYFLINYCQRSRPATMPPVDFWFMALTRYPLIFLVLSVLVPISLSFAVYAKSGYQVTVNLDFDSYLKINTPLENVRRAYDQAKAHQRDSLTVEAENCEYLSMNASQPLYETHHRDLIEEKMFSVKIDPHFVLDDLPPQHRELYSSNMLYASGGEAISIMYQNSKGGNVFEPEVLKDIFRFEQSIYSFPGFANFCFGFGPGRCIPIDSLVTHFFPGGNLVSDIDGVVRSFLGNQPALWKLDQNFGPDNLQSEVVRSFIFLQNVGGDQSAAHPFLKSLYRDYFWKTDQRDSYPAMIHTWDNEYLTKVEADDALHHDTLWSIGSLCFIAMMIFFKVRSLFVAFFSMLGLVLAFAASYYWVYMHFAVESATLLWVAGLYVMLGIGADDIFLMVDSFEHTKIEMGEIEENSRSNEEEANLGREAQLDLIRERMKKAYRKAGAMMLVSSLTTAICFFSNAFGILVVIQEFGIFMGMVVLVNFLHVMTILPSAILVNEFYVQPFQLRLNNWCKKSFPRVSCCKSVDKAAISRSDSIHEAFSSENHNSNFLDNTSQMNRMDRWLVSKYAPFITKRFRSALLLTVALAIILGGLGIAKFATSDGNIVLFSEKYNLGRLAVVTDTYFNKDVKKTIEENPETSTNPPTFSPVENIVSGGASHNTEGQEHSNGVSLPESATQGGSNSNSNGDNGTGTSGENNGDATSGSFPNIPADSEDPSGTNLPASDVSESVTATSIPAPTPVSGSAGSSSIGTGTSSGSTQSSGSQPGGSSPFPAPAPTPYYDQGVTSAPIAVAPLGPNSGLDLRRRETIFVNLIWGVKPEEKGSSLWKVRRSEHTASVRFEEAKVPSSSFDPSHPRNQEALYRAVQMARNDDSLHVQPDKTTWIEMLRVFAVDTGIGFPIPRDLFVGCTKILKERDTKFSDLVSREIGTQSPGLAGDFTFVSVTLEVDAIQNESLSLSETVYRQWTKFADKVNLNSTSDVPDMVAQSRIFLDAYRVEATIESTVATWFIANGLCLLVILLFTRNVALSFMVMGTITLIFLCLGGIIFSIFRIPFGAVEALGISIFIGLSANYSLHVVHAYHHAKGDSRLSKVNEAIFAVGGPIVASALSTMGASAFLFGCRTWVFVELGILVCSITAMALLYSMTFLLAWLVISGPRPLEREGQRIHAWDIRDLCCLEFPCFLTRQQLENVHHQNELDNDWNTGDSPEKTDLGGTTCVDLVSSNDSLELPDQDDNSDNSIEVVEGDQNFFMTNTEDGSDSSDHFIMVVEE